MTVEQLAFTAASVVELILSWQGWVHLLKRRQWGKPEPTGAPPFLPACGLKLRMPHPVRPENTPAIVNKSPFGSRLPSLFDVLLHQEMQLCDFQLFAPHYGNPT